jgi:hypothetical protein
MCEQAREVARLEISAITMIYDCCFPISRSFSSKPTRKL